MTNSYAVDDRLYPSPKKDALLGTYTVAIKKDIKNMLIFIMHGSILMLIKLITLEPGVKLPNGCIATVVFHRLWHLIHSLLYTRHIYVYMSPALIWIASYIL